VIATVNAALALGFILWRDRRQIAWMPLALAVSLVLAVSGFGTAQLRDLGDSRVLEALSLILSEKESVDKLEAMVSPAAPGSELPGSVDQSRLKPTGQTSSESSSEDFFSTQPGNSFPGVAPPPALARKPTHSLLAGIQAATPWMPAVRLRA
jgi:hypothetical protein